MNTQRYAIAIAMLTLVASAACDDSETDNHSNIQHNLFSCELDVPCSTVWIQTTLEPAAGLACQANRVINDTPGAMLFEQRPGPGTAQSDELTLLLGNGTAILQRRARSVVSAGDEFGDWALISTELCQVDMPDALATACAAEGDPACSWTSWDLTDCEPVVVTDCNGSVEQDPAGAS